VIVAIGAVTAGCSDDAGNDAGATTTTAPAADDTASTTTTEPEPGPSVAAATLEGPVTVGAPSPPADPRPVDLAAVGYVEEEWFAGGTATSYRQVGERTADGRWDAEPAATAPYRTRFLVRRPADPADFSGIVVVEWLNVSAVEASPEWSYTSAAIIDAGAAWVGLSTQAFGVVGGQSLLDTGADDQDAAGGGIRGANPERYASLEHPGDAYAFDIWSQVGAALSDDTGEAVLGGPAEVLIAAGESQSAGFLTGYINAVHPLARVYDGFFVHSRGDGAATLDGEPTIRGTDVGYRIRDDLDVPVLIFETETDVGPLLRYSLARQDDTDRLRVWEVAGTAHADAHLVGREFGLCPGGINDGPQHWVAKAAVEALLAWVVDGVEPPRGEPIETTGDGTEVVRDEHGLARGGIRTPSVDAPVSALSGEAPPGTEILCALFGSSTPFDAATLAELYPTRDDYLARFDAALHVAVEAGFVRAADRDAYAAEARAVDLP
jgi:hypothetical protein